MTNEHIDFIHKQLSSNPKYNTFLVSKVPIFILEDEVVKDLAHKWFYTTSSMVRLYCESEILNRIGRVNESR